MGSCFSRPPEHSLKGCPPHTATAGEAASQAVQKQLAVCVCASLEPPLFPAFSQACVVPSTSALGPARGVKLVRRRRAYSPPPPTTPHPQSRKHGLGGGDRGRKIPQEKRNRRTRRQEREGGAPSSNGSQAQPRLQRWRPASSLSWQRTWPAPTPGRGPEAPHFYPFKRRAEPRSRGSLPGKVSGMARLSQHMGGFPAHGKIGTSLLGCSPRGSALVLPEGRFSPPPGLPFCWPRAL